MDAARRAAGKWLARGIGIVMVGEAEPRILFIQGDSSGLDSSASAVLHSRTPKQLHPEDRWLKITEHLLDCNVPADHTLVASIGNYAYELAGYLAVRAGRSLIVVCDRVLPGMTDDIGVADGGVLAEFMAHRKTLLASPFLPGGKVAPREVGVIRDGCVVALADMVRAGEIRSNGNMERLCLNAISQGKPVSVFQPDRFDRATAGNRRLLDAGAMPIDVPELIAKRSKHKSQPLQVAKTTAISTSLRLFHFTRACPGPWPGQTAFEYYRSVVDNESGAAHTAFDTLKRILEERRIRGANKLTRGPEPVVSFTGGGLGDLDRMIQWRTGFARWTFEPYGLGFPRETMMTLGARPVVYGDEPLWKRLPKTEQYRYQVSRPDNRTWEREKEWRLLGDLTFDSIPDRDILVVVAAETEAEEIRDRFGLKALPVLISE